MKKIVCWLFFLHFLSPVFFLQTTELGLKEIYFVYHGGYNAGDFYCCPKLYYDFEGYKINTIFFSEFNKNEKNRSNKLKNAIVIFGGGGILDVTSTMSCLYNNMDVSNKCFHWGSGSNRLNLNVIDWKLAKDEIDVKDDVLKNFCLVGRRDFQNNYYENHTYVPCVSCKLQYLKNKYEIKRRIGVVNHTGLKLIKNFYFSKIDMNLTKYKIDEIIRFIGESEIIITSSFHAAYWGLLMNKKVLINGNWSSKFDTLKYKPTLLSGDLGKDILNCCVPPKDYLEECINLNDAFYEKIMCLLK